MLDFLKDESGQGVVTEAILLIIVALLAYFLYSYLKPGVIGAGSGIGGVLQQQ